MVDIKVTAKRSRRSPGAIPPDEAPAAPLPRRSRRKSDSATTFTTEERYRMVEKAAYYRAERRGFEAGHEADDWLAAEAEIDALISAPSRTAARKSRTN